MGCGLIIYVIDFILRVEECIKGLRGYRLGAKGLWLYKILGYMAI
jgi:hypothetical protein